MANSVYPLVVWSSPANPPCLNGAAAKGVAAGDGAALMASSVYPLVVWSSPANPLCLNGAATKGVAAGDGAAPSEVASLRAEIAHLRADVAFWMQQGYDWKRKAAFYQRMFQKAGTKAVAREAELQAKIAELQATIRQHEHEVRGPKSEAYPGSQPRKPSGRKRGHQPGQGKTPRRNFDHLPTREEAVVLPPEQRCCPRCHQPLADFPGTDDGAIIELEVRAYRRRYRRKRYRRTCTCPDVPAIVTAPPPPKVVPKGILGVSVWVEVLVCKFAQYQPTHRLLSGLRDHGLDLSSATVTDGLKHIHPLMLPIYEGLARRQRQEDRWQADETRWLVFVKDEGPPGHAWSMFVVRSPDSIVFILDAARTHKVPEHHLSDAGPGILSVDRTSIYKAMRQVKNGQIILAFCWAHQRRDFLGLLVAWKDHAAVADWSANWLERIARLFQANDARVRALADPVAFAAHDRIVREQVADLARQRDDELQQADLHPACAKVLRSLQRHWDGLTVFVDHPEVPMDNNAAERSERGPALGRKNYYGSGALWSGQLAAMMFSICQTLELWGLSCHDWLSAYLQACAAAGGRPPPNPAVFLPWNLSDEQRQAWALPKKNPSRPPPPDTS